MTDDDLTTLCVDCHDAITSVRRRVRYGEREIEAEAMDDTKVHLSMTRSRPLAEADEIVAVSARTAHVPPRANLW